MNDILLSICIPTYNRANRLEHALKSVISNTFNNIEVIVSDNSSNNNTSEIVEKFKDTRIRYNKNETNIGANFNIIHTVEIARGDYILFLSDEDLINKNGLLVILNVIKSCKNAMVIFASIFDNPTDSYYLKIEKNMIVRSRKDRIKYFLFEHAYFSGICIKRNAIKLDKILEYQNNNPDFTYPHQHMVLQAMLKGACVLISDIIVIKGPDAGSNFYVQTKDKINDLYYSPYMRMRLIQHYINLIDINDKNDRFRRCAYIKIAKIAYRVKTSEIFKAFSKKDIRIYTSALKTNPKLRIWFLLYSIAGDTKKLVKNIIPANIVAFLKKAKVKIILCFKQKVSKR